MIDFGAGIGGPPSMARRGGAPRQVRFHRNNPVSHIDDTFFSDNDDGSDDDQTGYADFVTNMRRMNEQRGARVEQHQFAAVFGSYPLLADPSRLGGHDLGGAFAAASAAAQLTRSYATNAHVENAGGTADNALEIESDSDEDEVEVVDVRSGARM